MNAPQEFNPVKDIVEGASDFVVNARDLLQTSEKRKWPGEFTVLVFAPLGVFPRLVRVRVRGQGR